MINVNLNNLRNFLDIILTKTKGMVKIGRYTVKVDKAGYNLGLGLRKLGMSNNIKQLSSAASYSFTHKHK